MVHVALNYAVFPQHRAEVIVPNRMRKMEDAIHARDFQSFGKLTMQVCCHVYSMCVARTIP